MRLWCFFLKRIKFKRVSCARVFFKEKVNGVTIQIVNMPVFTVFF